MNAELRKCLDIFNCEKTPRHRGATTQAWKMWEGNEETSLFYISRARCTGSTVLTDSNVAKLKVLGRFCVQQRSNSILWHDIPPSTSLYSFFEYVTILQNHLVRASHFEESRHVKIYQRKIHACYIFGAWKSCSCSFWSAWQFHVLQL